MAGSSLTPEEFNRRVARVALVASGTVIVLAALWVIRDALVVIYISGLIAMGFSPLVRWISRAHGRGRQRVPRWVAILVIYVAILGGLTLIGLTVVPAVITQATNLSRRLPGEFTRLQSGLVSHGLMRRPITLSEAVQNAPSAATSSVSAAIEVGSGFVRGVFGVVTVLILSFYFLVEAEAILDYLIGFVPTDHRKGVMHRARQAVGKVSAWLQGNLILAGVSGTITAIGMGLLGEPFYYVVALVAALGETIPMIGPLIAGAVAASLALTVSVKLAVIVAIFFGALHEVEANLLVPKIMERRVGVNAVAIIVALLAGWELGGVLGAVLAIPTAAILSVILEEITARSPDLGRQGTSSR